jgi:glycosyltransferase involved in cell wall biosynthesis
MSIASSGASPSGAVAVTVVIPCFEARGTLRRAMESVFAQTMQPREVIAVDDASSDGTREELRRIRREVGVGRLKILRHARNLGPAAARNAGWDAATGKYVAFLDADDSWHPRKLEMQIRFMENNPQIAASGCLHLVSESGIHELQVKDNPRVAELGFRELLWRNRFITSSAMVRRELPLRFPERQRHMEDHWLWLEMTRAGHRIARIEAPLAAHHKPQFGAGGLSAQLGAMERAELGNYRALHRAGAIGAPLLAVLWAWSLAKFLRRLVIVAARRDQ